MGLKIDHSRPRAFLGGARAEGVSRRWEKPRAGEWNKPCQEQAWNLWRDGSRSPTKRMTDEPPRANP